jgi:hypothetical protein
VRNNESLKKRCIYSKISPLGVMCTSTVEMSNLSSDAEVKLAQLQAVFAKAVDMTFGEIGPSDLNDCFGGTRDKLGASHVDGAFVRNLGKSRDRLEVY